MIITVAKPFSVVSNGSSGSRPRKTPTAPATFHWKMDQPHSTYLITVAAAEFRQVYTITSATCPSNTT